MKIIIAHNRYGLPGRGSGEEVMVDAIISLLKEKGHIVIPFIRTSLDIQKMTFGKIRSFFSGIYSIKAKKDFLQLLIKEKPDIVFIQNVFPLISPSILLACNKISVPMVMRCPNYRLICPTGLFMRNEKPCELCTNGREYRCIIHNCEKFIFKSIGYALRNFVARKLRLFKDHIDVFMVLTEFAKNKLIENGFPARKISVISGLVAMDQLNSVSTINEGKYVGFAGRISREKGIDLFIDAAKDLPNVPFKIAGDHKGFELIVKKAPKNVEFLGKLGGKELKKFYEHSRVIVLPSKWYEGLPAVIIEAMLHAKPVICSDLGGLPEIVEQGITGLLFKHNNAKDLSGKILKLWDDPELAREFGNAGIKLAKNKYHPDVFYERLITAFNTAILNKK